MTLGFQSENFFKQKRKPFIIRLQDINVIYHKEYIIKKLFSEGVITVFQYTDYSPQGNPTTLQ